jgi:hypothetical protein
LRKCRHSRVPGRDATEFGLPSDEANQVPRILRNRSAWKFATEEVGVRSDLGRRCDFALQLVMP